MPTILDVNDCLTSGAIGQIDCSTSIAQVGSCLALYYQDFSNARFALHPSMEKA
jgi:hypothetical protein